MIVAHNLEITVSRIEPAINDLLDFNQLFFQPETPGTLLSSIP
jgi:hypothetical protein